MRLLLALTLLGFAAPRLAAQEGVSGRPGEVYRGPQVFQLTGTCGMEVSPDLAVIVGGVAVFSLKPTEANEQLDKQIALIQKYVEENHGRLALEERARTLKTPNPGIEERDPPFQVVQRLRAEFPVNAPVDAILEKMISLGLDRFGENVLNANSSRRESVVRFRIASFDKKLGELQQRCTDDAWMKWCATEGAKDLCEKAPSPSQLTVVNFSTRSEETVLQPEGNARRWQANYSLMPREVDAPELLGNVTLHLTANILLNCRWEPKP